MKKSLLFLAFAAFAMVFVSCSKSSSNGGGGGDVNYGTITFGNQTITIVHSGYTIGYDEDLDADIIGIALAQADDEQGAAIAIPFYSTVPTGQFTLTVSEEPEDGEAGLAIVLDAAPAYVATQGTITISQNGNNYTIDASGSSMSIMGTDVKDFTLHFTGPLPYYENEE